MVIGPLKPEAKCDWRGGALTLPSDTHTSWFCCCWMVSFRAPYQPSFMLFKLMVAERQRGLGHHGELSPHQRLIGTHQ